MSDVTIKYIAQKIPTGWVKYRLSGVATIQNGYPFESSKFTSDAGHPLVRIRDVMKGKTELRYDGEWVESASVNDGDTLVGMDGDFNVNQWNGGRSLLNQRVCAIRSKSGFNNEFLRYYLPIPLKVINDLTYSTTVKHLSSQDIGRIEFYAPKDMSGQEKIVSYLDVKTQTLDKILTAKNHTRTHLSELRQAIIAELVYPAGDSAMSGSDQLYRHLLSQESGTWGEDPNGINEVKCLRVADFDYVRLSHFDPSTKRSIAPAHTRTKMLQPGDILIEKSGGGEKTPVGRAVLVGKMDELATYANFIDRLRFKDTVLPEYALYLLYAMYSGGVNTKYIKQNTGIQNLDIKHYLMEPVSIPDIDKQREIVSKIKSKLQKIDKADATLQKSISQLEEYRSSLISNVVGGKVTI